MLRGRTAYKTTWKPNSEPVPAPSTSSKMPVTKRIHTFLENTSYFKYVFRGAQPTKHLETPSAHLSPPPPSSPPPAPPVIPRPLPSPSAPAAARPPSPPSDAAVDEGDGKEDGDAAPC